MFSRAVSLWVASLFGRFLRTSFSVSSSFVSLGGATRFHHFPFWLFLLLRYRRFTPALTSDSSFVAHKGKSLKAWVLTSPSHVGIRGIFTDYGCGIAVLLCQHETRAKKMRGNLCLRLKSCAAQCPFAFSNHAFGPARQMNCSGLTE